MKVIVIRINGVRTPFAVEEMNSKNKQIKSHLSCCTVAVDWTRDYYHRMPYTTQRTEIPYIVLFESIPSKSLL